MLKKFISIFIVPSITTITFLFAQNHSLSFDGSNDYVINSSLSGFNFSSTNEITIETWFMMESHSGYDGIVSMNANGIKYRMMVNPGMHPFYDAGMHYDVAVSDFAFSLNTWYHYALVIRGGGNAEVYVDGTLISSNPTGVPGSLPDASQILIGNGEGPGVHSSNAIIDECRIWNKALSSEEIQFYMSTPPENNESGLVGYWNFNEGEGSILSDKTSNGNDCTIYGSSWSYSIPPTLGEISDNDLLIETHDLLFTEYSLIESSQLEVGKKYYLKISGTYNVHGCCARFDAAYEYVDSNPPNPYREKWSWNGETNQIPYPSAYSPDHVYYFYFEGTGNSEVFMFQDEGGYGDNSGSLSIEIWERGNSDQETETNNYSLSFDGQDDYVQIPDSPNLDGMNQLTIQFYIKWNSFPFQTNGKGVSILEKW